MASQIYPSIMPEGRASADAWQYSGTTRFWNDALNTRCMQAADMIIHCMRK